MDLIEIGDRLYNLDHLVRAHWAEHERPPRPRRETEIEAPPSEKYRTLTLFFSDGQKVPLSEANSAAFAGLLATRPRALILPE